MARSITAIHQEIKDRLVTEFTAVGLTIDVVNWSRVNIIRLITYTVSVAIWTIEVLYDALREEISDLVSRMKPHTLRWYTETAKAFQYGYALPADSDKYDNAGLTAQQIADSKIVKYAACVRQIRANGRVFLRLKVAKEDSGDLVALDLVEKAAFTDYIFRVSDAGVDIHVDSLPPDQLKQTWTIYYDPLILDANGSRLDGQDSEPVRKAIKAYLLELLFNGTYAPTYHIDAVQRVEGVVIPSLTLCQSKYGAFEYSSIGVTYVPDAGYMRFVDDADLVINYLPQTEIR